MSEPQPEPTLFDRVGGEAGVTELVAAFYRRIFADPELAPFFQESDAQKLHRMQVEFFSAALGGPAIYSGAPLREVHAGRGIRKRHLRLFVQHLLATLQGLDLDEHEVNAIYDRIAVHADDITGGAAETG